MAIALLGTLGSIYLSVGMGLKACPFCFYQRSFMMAVFAVLTVGLIMDRARADFLCLLCLPLVTAGLAVAMFHEYLVLTNKLECPLGIFEVGTAPAQSLAVFAVLAVAVVMGAVRPVMACLGGTLLGVFMAWGCIVSSPPMPPAPIKPYDQPLEICRPPFTLPEIAQ